MDKACFMFKDCIDDGYDDVQFYFYGGITPETANHEFAVVEYSKPDSSSIITYNDSFSVTDSHFYKVMIRVTIDLFDRDSFLVRLQ